MRLILSHWMVFSVLVLCQLQVDRYTFASSRGELLTTCSKRPYKSHLTRQVVLSWACKAEENLSVKCTKWSFNPNVGEALPLSGIIFISSSTCLVFPLYFPMWSISLYFALSGILLVFNHTKYFALFFPNRYFPCSLHCQVYSCSFPCQLLPLNFSQSRIFLAFIPVRYFLCVLPCYAFSLYFAMSGIFLYFAL